VFFLPFEPNLGPLVMCGLGGVLVEVMKDVAFRLPPISDDDARAMVRSLKGHKLLEGFHGRPPADVEELVRCIRRVGQLVLDFPEIVESEVNPLILDADPESTQAVDARIIVNTSDHVTSKA
jgi:acetyltransferase